MSGEADLDARYDALLEPSLRRLSRVFFTPVHIAQLAFGWLSLTENDSVLDVGSGVGKLCILGALATPARFVGADQNERLTQVARGCAQNVGVERVTFLHSDALALDWAPYSALYLYNPFEEPLFDGRWHLPAERQQLHGAQAELTVRKLEVLAPGTRVVLFEGFGQSPGPAYVREQHALTDRGELSLWRRR